MSEITETAVTCEEGNLVACNEFVFQFIQGLYTNGEKAEMYQLARSILVFGVGTKYNYNYPQSMGVVAYEGPYKYWALTAYLMQVSSFFVISNLAFYTVQGSTPAYMTFTKLVAISAIGPLFVWWVLGLSIYRNYDTMKYLKTSDANYTVNQVLLISVALVDLLAFRLTYEDILKKYYTLKYAKEQ